MVDVLLLCREHDPPRSSSRSAARSPAGAIDGRAVAVLTAGADAARAAPLIVPDGSLSSTGPPLAWATTTSCSTARPER